MSCDHSHDRYEILRDSGHVENGTTSTRVADVKCECGVILGLVQHKGRPARLHALPPVYLKRNFGVKCGCEKNCGSFWCRKPKRKIA